MADINLSEQEVVQLRNIAETLIEATDHFTKYIKDRNMAQSINIFSAIVEGFQSIQQIFVAYNIESSNQLMNKTEKDLIVIAQQLENNETLKIAQVIQFSLMPRLKRLYTFFEPKDVKTKTIIGIFHDKANPKKLLPEARINALEKEAAKQHAKLLYFSSDDVDLKNSKVSGFVNENNSWENNLLDFPHVIHNTGVTNKHLQSITERKLRRMIPFTSFHVGNKFYLPKKMVKHRQYADLLVPFKMVTDKQVVYDYLKKEKIIVVKPILGARGESIYFIQQTKNRFTITDHRHERIFNQDAFNDWIESTLLRRKFSYMVQRYVHCLTKDKEPYDVRAHMQKNHEGKWEITKIYPRIGSKESILSNISRGGRTEELSDFLTEQFGEKMGMIHDKQLRSLSVDLSEYLDRIHNFSLDELGLDLAIDDNNRFWLHEVNNGPQSTFHEEDRAVNTIGYAKYIAYNGIVKQNQSTAEKGQFNAKNSDLPFVNTDSQYRVGMLIGDEEEDKLATACAYVAHFENAQFCTFSSQDIDYNQMLIKGSFFENGAWVDKITEYPHVIYDRLRLRGIKRFNDVYEELEGIPFTNEFYGNSISKLEVYDKLKSSGKLNDVMIPYKKVDNFRDILNYLEEYGAVIVKPEVGSFGIGVHYIAKSDNKNYIVVEREKETEYNEVDLRRYFNNLFKENTFIVQQYINTRTVDDNPFDIRVHMMKDGNDEWDFVHLYPRIGFHYAIISATGNGGYIGKLEGFLDRNYSKVQSVKIKDNIKYLAHQITEVFSTLYDEKFNEIAFDFALDEKGTPFLIELNINKPGIVNFEFDLARLAIPNAIYIAEQYRLGSRSKQKTN